MGNELLVRDVLMLAYKAFGGSMKGKTLLQKRVYFLSVVLDMGLGYDAHYYGPYSEDVASANSELKSLGYVSEFSSSWGFDQRGFEMARYDYTLNETGQRIAERKAEQHRELWDRIESAAKVLNEAGNLDYMELSIAAKAYIVLTRLNGKATLDDIAGMLPKFGWSVTKEELAKATEFLAKANLVTQN